LLKRERSLIDEKDTIKRRGWGETLEDRRRLAVGTVRKKPSLAWRAQAADDQQTKGWKIYMEPAHSMAEGRSLSPCGEKRKKVRMDKLGKKKGESIQAPLG